MHIRPQDWPQAQWAEGGSVLKISKGGHCEAPESAVRGHINGFSAASRRRLMLTIGQVRRDADLPNFITLTYPDHFVSARESKRHLKMLLQRMGRVFAGHGSIWKLEPQDRGAPHYHLLTWGAELYELRAAIPGMWYEIAGDHDQRHLLWHMGLCGNGNKHCVQQVNSFRGVWAYAAKYLGKTFEVTGWDHAGRYWGVVNRHNVPFGEMRSEPLPFRTAVQVQRLQRRFSGQRPAKRTMVTFCDADQWVSRLHITEDVTGSGLGPMTDYALDIGGVLADP